MFDRYSNLDNSFDKTTIPFKNMFESASVSGSRAKRECNILNEFREVILDFEGLEWMGQGFAHQVFVVFHNASECPLFFICTYFSFHLPGAFEK